MCWTTAHSQEWLFHGRNRGDANAKAHRQDCLCHVNGGRGLALFFRTRKIRAFLLKMARPVARSGGGSVSGYATTQELSASPVRRLTAKRAPPLISRGAVGTFQAYFRV
jgi:hypothetical protein